MEKVGVVGWCLKVIKVWWISKRGSLIKCLLSWAVVSVFSEKKQNYDKIYSTFKKYDTVALFNSFHLSSVY